ncbi:hypothetical protein LCGC14_2499970 [marine sediment metagenome]|uniref:Uncharacterized protein n=1 Tax=marine sediment metagenome TaxID=412755 RepID=A0A0F9B231_9ZZZZ
MELRDAHHHLYADGKKKIGRRWPTKTWERYCEEIGYAKSTCNRWLQHYLPDYYERFQQRKVADATIRIAKTGEMEGVTNIERRGSRGYIRPMDDYVLDKGRDPFMRPKKDPDAWKVRRRLKFLFRKYLTYRQNIAATLHFFNGRTPEEIAAYYAKDRKGDPLTADGVYRSLKRIRWLMVRRYAYLFGCRLHKKFPEILSPDEIKVLGGWIEAEKYVWRGAGKE